MLYIRNKNTNPYFNLAAEEYFLKNYDDECFMLWQNAPCIVIGKNQNALSEINTDYVKEHDIIVIRRLSGGGAVFHDLGNINFTFITNKDKNDSINFRKFTQPIIDALRDLSINAEFSGRNDITIEGRKFSGNAQYHYKNRVLHHGTLLFSGNLTDLTQALKPKPMKFEDKSVKSVASRVTYISHHLPTPMTVPGFIDFLAEHVMKSNNIAKASEFTKEDLEIINRMAEERYSTWDWNFGSFREYNFSSERRLSGGSMETKLEVEKGIIRDIKIFGDFFGERDIKDIENALIGVRHSEDSIRDALEPYEIGKYFANITVDELISVLL